MSVSHALRVRTLRLLARHAPRASMENFWFPRTPAFAAQQGNTSWVTSTVSRARRVAAAVPPLAALRAAALALLAVLAMVRCVVTVASKLTRRSVARAVASLAILASTALAATARRAPLAASSHLNACASGVQVARICSVLSHRSITARCAQAGTIARLTGARALTLCTATAAAQANSAPALPHATSAPTANLRALSMRTRALHARPDDILHTRRAHAINVASAKAHGVLSTAAHVALRLIRRQARTRLARATSISAL